MLFSLGLELENRIVPQVCTVSRADMGVVGFATLSFHINNHPFTQKFIVCHKQNQKSNPRSRFFNLYLCRM